MRFRVSLSEYSHGDVDAEDRRRFYFQFGLGLGPVGGDSVRHDATDDEVGISLPDAYRITLAVRRFTMRLWPSY